MPKYRYEYPSRTAHFLEAPDAQAVVKFVRRTYPHNYDEVLPTLVEIPRWPEFWRTVDGAGRVLPTPQD